MTIILLHIERLVLKNKLREAENGSEHLDREFCRIMNIPWNSEEEYDNMHTFPKRVWFTRNLARTLTLIPVGVSHGYSGPWYKISQNGSSLAHAKVRLNYRYDYEEDEYKYDEVMEMGYTPELALCQCLLNSKS